VNILSLLELVKGEWDRNALKMAFAMASPMPHDHWYQRFTGKSKTFKKNKRRGL
jgi:hypothetical protein